MNKKGFNLIELMLIIVVIGVLAKLTYVGYSNYIIRSNEELVKTKLQQNISKMEVYYSQNGRYITANNSWPAIIESNFTGVGGIVYTISMYPAQATSANTRRFCMVASPKAGSIQENQPIIYADKSGNLFSAPPSDCSIAAPPIIRGHPRCNDGASYPPCSGVCQGVGSNLGGPYSACSGNCDRVLVCGNPISPGCSGNCQDSFIEGPCSGNCDRVTMYVPQSMTRPCNGNCHNVVIIRTD